MSLDAAIALVRAPITVESYQALINLYRQAEGEEKEKIGTLFEVAIESIADTEVLAECLSLTATQEDQPNGPTSPPMF